MRNIIFTGVISLDGFYAGPGGNPMALPMDHAFNGYNLERLQTADTLLCGASTYRGFSQYWPSVLADADAPAEQRAIAEQNHRAGKVVVSDTLTPEETSGWGANTELVRRADAHARIAELDGEILMFGSGVLLKDLLRAGLVDELHLLVGNVAIGDGLALFDAPVDLELVSTRTWDGSSNVLHVYKVKHQSAR